MKDVVKQHPNKKPKKSTSPLPFFIVLIFSITLLGGAILSTPLLLAFNIHHRESVLPTHDQFPVTVDPQNKIIVESAEVNAFLAQPNSPLSIAPRGTGNKIWDFFTQVATTIEDMPWYQGIASVDGRLIVITPGMRKEQVASFFAKALGWNTKQSKEFLTRTASSTLPFAEGSFSPGTYFVSTGTTPHEAQAVVNTRFENEVLAHYGTTTSERVPLDQALTIASLIERETLDTGDMRLVSGVIWNRLFANMNLQIDATVQYAKANDTRIANWWPKVVPADMSRKSPYNTYRNPGLPPTPIANPSVAAILAALNPLKTPCLFYFNDTQGNILCTNTYTEHVALLKKYYGRGK